MEKPKEKKKIYKKWWFWVIIVSFLVAGNNYYKNSNGLNNIPNQKETPAPITKQNTTTQATTEQATIETGNPIAFITKTVDEVGDFEVSVWTLDGNPATVESTPPFEIIVNTTLGQVDNCFDAKSALFDIMRRLYTSSEIKDKIARVQFTAWGQLKASLGHADIGFDWNNSGPSNFWKTLLKYKPYEDQTSPMDQRTWGVQINKDCN